MLKERRHALIVERIRASGAATIGELSEAIGVSGSTVRRDLKSLSERGQVRLTHGGAVLPQEHLAAFELDSTLAAEIAPRQKSAIGKFAASLVEPGQTVIFDSSTTVLAAAWAILERELTITAITNSLEIATSLSRSRTIEVITVGGRVRLGSPTLTGPPGLSFLEDLHADLALLGTHAISGTLLTETSLDVIAMKRAMIAASRRAMVLADDSKFQPPALFTICHIDQIDEVVTNAGADAEALSILRDAGCRVHLAPCTP
ncbi:MAG: DeoR/GlpR family DNA-binding transcription regulator [Azospirillaceae bacterium]